MADAIGGITQEPIWYKKKPEFQVQTPGAYMACKNIDNYNIDNYNIGDYLNGTKAYNT